MPEKTVNKRSKKSKGAVKIQSSASAFAEEEHGPYAVILADLESDRFDPLIQTVPHCLLPLGNVPMIQYTLLRLIQDGFKDILIYACRHAEQVADFVHKTITSSSARMHVYNGGSSRTIGDVMRDLERNQFIPATTDFLLVPADLICAMSLRDIFDAHQRRRSSNPNSIMSLVLPSPCNLISASQASEWKVAVSYLASDDGRLTNLSKSTSGSSSSQILLSDLLRSDVSVEISTDLMDIGVAVCSSYIPSLFQDNFDYETMHDLIHDVLLNEEVMGYSVYVASTPSGIPVLRAAPDLDSLIHLGPEILCGAACVNSITIHPAHMLQSTDANWCIERIGYAAFVASSAQIHPRAQIIGACFIGPGCEIGDSVTLIDCIFYQDCVIGRGARLRKVVAGSEVCIGDHVVADIAWLCNRACLLSGIRLPKRSFVGPSQGDVVVTLGPGRGSLSEKNVLVAPGSSDVVLDPNIGGENVWATAYTGKRKRNQSGMFMGEEKDDGWSMASGGDDSHPLEPSGCTLWDTAFDRLIRNAKLERFLLRTREASGSGSGIGRLSKSFRKERRDTSRSQFTSEGDAGSTDDEGEDDDDDDNNDEGEKSEAFLVNEIRHTLEHSDQNTESVDNIILEVNSLKHAHNIPIDDLYFLLTKAILDLTLSSINSAVLANAKPGKSETKQFTAEFIKQVQRFQAVLSSYFSRSDVAGRQCLQAVEDTACYKPLVMSASPFILHALYDQDLVTEDTIWWWLDHSPLLVDDELQQSTSALRQTLAPFLTWLKDAQEEDDSDD